MAARPGQPAGGAQRSSRCGCSGRSCRPPIRPAAVIQPERVVGLEQINRAVHRPAQRVLLAPLTGLPGGEGGGHGCPLLLGVDQLVQRGEVLLDGEVAGAVDGLVVVGDAGDLHDLVQPDLRAVLPLAVAAGTGAGDSLGKGGGHLCYRPLGGAVPCLSGQVGRLCCYAASAASYRTRRSRSNFLIRRLSVFSLTPSAIAARSVSPLAAFRASVTCSGVSGIGVLM